LMAADEVAINLAENLDRKDVSVVELGKGFKDLKRMGLTEKQIAVRLGVSKIFVANALNLWKVIPRKFQDKITTGFGKRNVPGRISFKAATDCVNLKKQHELTTKHYNTLLESAEGGYNCGQLKQIATKLSSGSTTHAARSSGGDITRVNIVFHADKKKRARFEKKVGINLSTFIRRKLLKDTQLKNVLSK